MKSKKNKTEDWEKEFNELLFPECPTEEKEPFLWKWKKSGRKIIIDFINTLLKEKEEAYKRQLEDEIIKYQKELLRDYKEEISEVAEKKYIEGREYEKKEWLRKFKRWKARDEVPNLRCPFCDSGIYGLPKGLSIKKINGVIIPLLRLQGFEIRKIRKNKKEK